MSLSHASDVAELTADLTEAARIALASAWRDDRAVWETFLAFDARLNRIVTRAREPMLAQMRLAWWRDELAKPADLRPRGDQVLDAIGANWSGYESVLAELIDGWEHLLGEGELRLDGAGRFAAGCGLACAGLARRLQEGQAAEPARHAGEAWALAGLASRETDGVARARALELAGRLPEAAGRMPRRLRPLAVLGGLARRSLVRGGAPLVGDRISPLVTLRLGLLGR